MNLAKVTYDYADEQKDAKQKSERLTAINDLIQLLNDQRMVTQLFIPNIETVMDMIKKNIFRPLPNTNRTRSRRRGTRTISLLATYKRYLRNFP